MASMSSNTAPELDDALLTARLRLAVVRLARQVRRNAQTGITPSQLSALVTVERHGPLPPARLAEHETVGRSTVTRLIRRLEDAGLIDRVPDPTDGRSFLLSVTPAGARLLKESRGRAEAFLAQRVARLDAADRAELERVSEILERLAERP